ncbi:hypothetical protein [Salinibacter phage M8CRM-1]|uniref:Uncharacterized protein n=3 Tax=Kryptosalinivirus TaxID=2560163 RepID=A0A2I6UG62_9CAUD|nr:hypothetical protein FGG63_gp53 [Salinibacter phage M8CC-19]YP_009639521.1 hypothetical protein FGG67_gp55 [Salinibacter phage M8CRM-1]AUO78983.1 hypothetical protein [Salinibacter phage M8CC-19]AUO79142.1 hypothetical protein [Salinibacter phage M8CRM-1]AUO79217.1 hypothetical protein [Salinibacter phage M31CC-1]
MYHGHTEKQRREAHLALTLAEFFTPKGVLETPKTGYEMILGPDGVGMQLVGIDDGREGMRFWSRSEGASAFELEDIVPFTLVLRQLTNESELSWAEWQSRGLDLHLVFINAMMLNTAAFALTHGYDNSGFPLADTINVSQSLNG